MILISILGKFNLCFLFLSKLMHEFVNLERGRKPNFSHPFKESIHMHCYIFHPSLTINFNSYLQLIIFISLIKVIQCPSLTKPSVMKKKTDQNVRSNRALNHSGLKVWTVLSVTWPVGLVRIGRTGKNGLDRKF